MMVNRSGVAAPFGDALRFRPAVIAAVLGLALSTFAWFAVAAWEDRFAKRDFVESATDQAEVLQTGLDVYLHKLVALRAFFNASTVGVTRSEFNVFTKDLIDDRKAILGFAWIPRVTREGRVAHELEGLRDGIPDYEIRSVGPDGGMNPALEQDDYFPVYYSNQPLTGQGYGINLQDGGVRQRPLDRARDGNLPAASSSLRLQVGTGDRNGFFVVLPVYRPDSPTTRSTNGGALSRASCRACSNSMSWSMPFWPA